MEAPLVSQQTLGLPAREIAKWGQAYGVTWDFYSQASLLFQAMKRANSVDSTAISNILKDPSQTWSWDAIAGGTAQFGSSSAMTIFGADGSHQISHACMIGIIHNGVDTNASVINP